MIKPSYKGLLLTSALAFIPLLQNVPAEAQVTDYGPDTCIQGYVWREAVPNDLVCVTPETRSQAAYDNSQASVRRSPVGGPYGPDTCIQGYVWRDAVAGDRVCVTPENRSQAAYDNSQSAARTAQAALGGSTTPQNTSVTPVSVTPAQRRITVAGRIEIVDDETFGGDEYGTISVRGATNVNKDQPQSLVEGLEGCAGDEVRVVLDLDAALSDGDNVIVTGNARLYEGTDCATTDLEQEKLINILIPPDAPFTYTINLINADEGGDTAKITLTFTNQ